MHLDAITNYITTVSLFSLSYCEVNLRISLLLSLKNFHGDLDSEQISGSEKCKQNPKRANIAKRTFKCHETFTTKA